jgi:hypothetical protein
MTAKELIEMLILAVTYQHVRLNITNGAQYIKGRVISFTYS